MNKIIKIITEKTIEIKDIDNDKLWESDSLEVIPFDGRLMKDINKLPDYMIAYEDKKNKFVQYNDMWYSDLYDAFDDDSPVTSGNLVVINRIFEQAVEDSYKSIALFQEVGWSEETGFPVYRMIKYAKIKYKKIETNPRMERISMFQTGTE